MPFATTNPATGKTEKEFPTMTPAEVDALLDSTVPGRRGLQPDHVAGGHFAQRWHFVSGLGPGSVPLDVLVRARAEVVPQLFGMLAAGQLQLTTRREPLENVEAVWTQREPSGTRVVFTP